MKGKIASGRDVSRRMVVASVLCGSAAMMAAPAQALDMEQYFKGKTITVIVGSAPGGGADFNVRLFTRFADRHFPGKPRFIVQNMPGSDQLKGLQAGVRAKPDGMTAVSLNSRWAIQSMLGQDLSPFDIKTARIVGSPIAGGRPEIFCSDRKIASSWDQVMALKSPLTFAGAPGSRSSIGVALLEMLGLPFKTITGYGGVGEEVAAFDRGELKANACNEATVPRLFPEWLTQKKLFPLFWWDIPSRPEYLAQMGATQPVPHVLELPGVNYPPDSKVVLDVSLKMFAFTRAIVLPPKTPDDIYQQWVESYAATHQDPDLIEAGAKGGHDIQLGRAADFEEALKSFQTLTPSGRDLFKKLMLE